MASKIQNGATAAAVTDSKTPAVNVTLTQTAAKLSEVINAHPSVVQPTAAIPSKKKKPLSGGGTSSVHTYTAGKFKEQFWRR